LEEICIVQKEINCVEICEEDRLYIGHIMYIH